MKTRAVLLAVVVLLLAGCAERSAPSGGMTPQELDEYRAAVADRMWQFTGLDDSLRPTVEVRTLDPGDWMIQMEQCAATKVTGAPELRTKVTVAAYVCRATHQRSPEVHSMLNTAQLDYLYDYYQQVLIPCLRLHGVVVPEPLTRSEATDVGRFAGYPWNPYGDVVDFAREDLRDMTAWHFCPAFPPDPIFDPFWERFEPYLPD